MIRSAPPGFCSKGYMRGELQVRDHRATRESEPVMLHSIDSITVTIQNQ